MVCVLTVQAGNARADVAAVHSLPLIAEPAHQLGRLTAALAC
jgi:hypothetical protein